RAALSLLAGEPEADSLCARLNARANAQLAEDGCDVVVDRPFGEHEPLGDLGIPQPFGDESEHLLLARRQTARISRSRRTRSPRQPARSEFALAASDERR